MEVELSYIDATLTHNHTCFVMQTKATEFHANAFTPITLTS